MTNVALKMPLQSSVSLQKPSIDHVYCQPKLDRAGHKHQNHIISRSHQHRERGVILTLLGWNRLQAAKSQAEFQENAGDRFTLEELSERTELALGTVSKILGRFKPVDRYSLQRVFESFNLELKKSDYSHPKSPLNSLHLQQKNPKQDWGEAVDVSLFCGRETDLTTLQQWVLEEHCRLVALLGMGGIGKSTLAVKFATQIEQGFETVVWRSLQNAPSLEELLDSILPFLLNTLGVNLPLPANLDRKIATLMDCLRSSRCLLILDNMETSLAPGDHIGCCRVGYESYSQLLQCFGAIPHQSCVILTSREKPRQIALLEGEKLPVRSLRLGALKPTEGRELFQQKGQFNGLEAEWDALIEHYGGQPLALKLVATVTQELFNGNIAEVLKYIEQGLLVFDDIRDVLNCQFDRLSPLEQEVMLWLAIHQEPISLDELRENLVTTTSKWRLPGVLNSLLRRSLIEPTLVEPNQQNLIKFSLQPLMMKCVLERLIQQVCEELRMSVQDNFLIANSQFSVLRTHCLFQEPASERIRMQQKKLIFQPIAEWLQQEANKLQEIEQWFAQLQEQQSQASPQFGYTITNLFNLLMHYQQLNLI